jgi:hypothetical protein
MVTKETKPKPKKPTSLGTRLRRRGFDETYYDRSDKSYRVRCSQCSAMVISGVACHETGCPNSK